MVQRHDQQHERAIIKARLIREGFTEDTADRRLLIEKLMVRRPIKEDRSADSR
jgi:hypothetical protein